MNMVKRHFTGLFDFYGRENRQPFWLWVLICYGIQTALTMIAMIPFFVWMIQKVQVIIATAPRGGPPPMKPEDMAVEMQSMVVGMGFFSAIASAVFALLLLAAIVRRLHDRNMSGWWGFPVLLTNIISQVASLSMMASIKIQIPDPKMPPPPVTSAQIGSIGFQFLAFVTMIVLIVFLALRGTQGPNKYGPDPLFEL